jgi:hypothetical protein
MKTYRHAPQGHASHNEVHRANHQTRGPASPLGNPFPGDSRPQERVVRRDEDFASAPMEFVKKGSIPEPNQRGGVTAVKGRHGPQMNEDVS